MARIIVAAGGREDDLAQIVFGYGLFTGGFGLHYGLEKVGITVLPMSSGNSERQLMMMQDFGSTIVVGTPSYVLYLSEVAEEMGLSKDDFKLRLGLLVEKAILFPCERNWKNAGVSWLPRITA